jgi:hypothetical protein
MPGGAVDIKAVEALAEELDGDDVAATAKRQIITTAGARCLSRVRRLHVRAQHHASSHRR